MSDDSKPDGSQAAEASQVFEIRKIYLKDVSFESPLAPGLFTEQRQWRPEYNVQLNAESHPQGESLFEVVLSITVTAKLDQDTAWLVEVKQAGLFRLEGFATPVLGHMLGSYCPNTLLPFAREAVADLVGKGGLPAFLLTPINFDALYAQHLKKLGTSVAAPQTAQ